MGPGAAEDGTDSWSCGGEGWDRQVLTGGGVIAGSGGILHRQPQLHGTHERGHRHRAAARKQGGGGWLAAAAAAASEQRQHRSVSDRPSLPAGRQSALELVGHMPKVSRGT